MTDGPSNAAGPDAPQDVASGANPVGALAMEIAELNERIGFLRDDVGEIPTKIIAGINPPMIRGFEDTSMARAPTFGRLVLLLIAGATVAWLAGPLSPFGQSAVRAVVVALALPLICLVVILGRTTSSRES